MHPATSLTSILPPPPPPPQHMMAPYNNPVNPICWTTTAEASAPAAESVNSGHFHHHPSILPPLPQQQRAEEVKDIEMKPLDLSLRPPRQNENKNNTSLLSSSPSSWPRPSSTSSASRSGSQRLSPYPILSQSSGSLSSSSSSRHLGSPCLTQSRSPLSRSISPYYPYHRQTPSPYYLSGSCTPPDNCSSLQVLSSTNRLLNALSSVSSSQLRSYDETSNSSPAPADVMAVISGESTRLMKDTESSTRRHYRHQQQNNADVDADSEEPTYIDMDSSATVVKSVSSPSRQVQHHHPRSNHETSSAYTDSTAMSSSSHDVPVSNQTPLTSQQHQHPSSPSSNHHAIVAENSSPQDVPNFHIHHHHHQLHPQQQHQHPHLQAVDSMDYHRSSIATSSCPSFISNNLQSPSLDSSSSLSSSPPSLRSLSNSHTLHLCDSSNPGSNNAARNNSRGSSSNNNGIFPYYNSSDDKNAEAVTPSAPNLASNPVIDYVRDIRTYHGNNQQQPPTVVQEMLNAQPHQNPDSSSSPSDHNLDSFSSPSSSSSSFFSTNSSSVWRTASTNACLTSPNNESSNSSNNGTISSQRLHSPHNNSVDSNISRSALSMLKSPSNNKENIRFINGGSSVVSHHTTNDNATRDNVTNGVSGSSGSNGGGGTGPTTTARRSFFQIDKSLLEENSGSALFTDDNSRNGDESGRSNPLDFWISKILMEETPRRRCGADIRHTVDGNKKIRLRLVDLIELQVEQSLLKA